MPDIVLIIIPLLILFAFVAGLSVGDMLKLPDFAFYIFLASFIAASFFYVKVVYLYSTSEWQTKEQIIVSHKVEGADYAKIHGKLKNLNEEFGRAFEDGEEITIIVPDENAVYPYNIVPLNNYVKVWLK